MADLSKTVHVYSDGRVIVNTYHPEIHPNEMEKPIELEAGSREHAAIVNAVGLTSLVKQEGSAPIVEEVPEGTPAESNKTE